ncbi:hypothetical protein LINPERHAP2_LOCUS23347, partial [Linum perenne]
TFNSENNFLHSHIHITLVLSIYQEEEPLIANWASTRTLPSGHSSLRNVIERCFGVLKRRWSILKMMCSYSFSKQTDIVLACCAIHNFIRMHAQGDTIFAEFEESDGQAETSESMARIEFGTSSSQVREMASKRDGIANQMWSDECANN